MPWQKVVRHISDSRIVVESKSGNQYPVTPEYERYGSDLYSQMSNRTHDHKSYWGFIQFDDGDPLMVDWTVNRSDQPPENPSWDR